MKRWTVKARPPKGRDGSNYQLVIRSPEGRVTQRSSGTDDPHEAERLAELEEKRRNGEAPPACPSVAEVVAMHLHHRELDDVTARDTLDNIRKALKRMAPLIEAPPTRGAILIARDKLRRGPRPLRPNTVNLYTTVIGVAWRWAFERELVPCDWPRVKTLKAPRTKKRPPTRAEVARLLDAFARYGDPIGWLHPIVCLVYDSGARLGEVLKLREGDLDREAGLVRIGTSKTGKGRVVAVDPIVLALAPKRPKPDDLVFVGPRRRQLVSRNTVSCAMRRLRKQARIPADVDIHSLRRGWIADSLRAGVSLPESMRHTGHSSARVHLDYQRLTPTVRALEVAQTVREARGGLPHRNPHQEEGESLATPCAASRLRSCSEREPIGQPGGYAALPHLPRISDAAGMQRWRRLRALRAVAAQEGGAEMP